VKKKTTWLAVAFGVLVLGYLVISSFSTAGARCRVCMSFKGAQDCRTASAANRQEALRTAITNACAQLSGGVIESSQCENTRPLSVEWLK
jgi:hypothetical protein